MMATDERKESAATVVLKLGDDVSTDAIYPGRFMATVLPSETPRHAFADLEQFNAKLRNGQIAPGSVVAAGSNFGCGSSREQAASTLKGHGLVIVARGYARIFLQNAVNLGLEVLVCPGLEAEENDRLRIEESGIRNETRGAWYPLDPLPAARRAIIDSGGLIPYSRERLVRRRASGSAATGSGE